MNLVDIGVLLILAWCAWSGWRSGILVQLSGIVGIVIGAWGAYRFSRVAGEWMGLERWPTELLFVVVLMSVTICVVLLAHGITRLFKAGGLAGPLRVVGSVFSVAKGILLLSLMLMAAESLLAWTHGKGGKKGLPSEVTQAKSYQPLQAVGEYVFPYIIAGTRAVVEEVRPTESVVSVTEPVAEPSPAEKSTSESTVERAAAAPAPKLTPKSVTPEKIAPKPAATADSVHQPTVAPGRTSTRSGLRRSN